jgi:AraC-like DNA-binding protein
MAEHRCFMLERPDLWIADSHVSTLHNMHMKPIVVPWGPGATDALGEALHFLRIDGVFYCRSELKGRWGASIPAIPDHLWFHVVTEGQGWLDTGEPEARLLQPGAFALVPHGQGHRLWSEPGVPTPGVLELEREQVSDRYEILRYGEGEGRTTMICGALCFNHPAARNLTNALPRTLVIDALHLPQTEWMQSTLRLMAAEAREPRPGGEAVITRLGDILVVQAIRSWIETDPAARSGWLGALKDRQIGRAIALIHRDPMRAWTVASLGQQVAMSRSAFAARFTELVGESVMRYITRWRMYAAMEALEEHDASVAEVASRLGYQSIAAFRRAFKRVVSVSPGAIRRDDVPKQRWPS